MVRAASRANHADRRATCARTSRACPGCSTTSTSLLRAGAIGGAEPNVADYQIAASTALLATLDDMGPLLAGRPALEQAYVPTK